MGIQLPNIERGHFHRALDALKLLIIFVCLLFLQRSIVCSTSGYFVSSIFVIHQKASRRESLGKAYPSGIINEPVWQ